MSLTERVSAAECYTVEEGIALYLFQQFIGIDDCTAVEVVGLGIMTALTIVRAALCEYRKSYAGT